MPLRFTVDGGRRLVFTVASGSLRVSDFAAHVQALADAGALEYSQVIDVRSARVDVTSQEHRNFTELIGRMRPGNGSTRTAFVAAGEADPGVARIYDAETAGADPGFRVFRDLPEARRWVLESFGGEVAVARDRARQDPMRPGPPEPTA